MEPDAMAGQRVTFHSPIGRLGVEVTARGLRRVLLPRPARGRAAHGHPADTRLPPAAAAVPGMEPHGMAVPVAHAVAQIAEYLRGERREFELPLDLTGLGSQSLLVLGELRARAPYGKLVTYGDLARLTGCRGGARAVGQIMARNPLPLVIPCHRVVAAGDLGGYGGGLALKRRLLQMEGALPEQPSLLGAAELGCAAGDEATGNIAAV